jgi:predicted  nucleic acid-binding Zn-ribbon protein
LDTTHIGQLIELQECDSKIQAIQAKKAEGPGRIEQLKLGREEVETRLNKVLAQLEESRRERRESEQRIEDLEAKIGHSNEKLSSIKSNKEYRAALKEIKDLNREKTRLEDKALEVMEAIEELAEGQEAAKAESEEAARRYEMDRSRIEQELESLDRELNRQLETREGLTRNVDGGMLRLYDSLRKNRGGIAISPVIKGVCQTCHLRIPPQQFIELIRGEKMMNCPHCRRIIYWGEEEGAQGGDAEKTAGMSE